MHARPEATKSLSRRLALGPSRRCRWGLFTLVTLRDGLIAQITEYLSRDEALKVVGLQE